MNKQKGEQTISQLYADKRSKTVIIVALALSNIALVLLAVYMFANRTVQINMPSQQRGVYQIGSDTANKDYFIDHAADVVNLIYNVTPINVDEKFATLLERVPVQYQKDIKQYLDQASERIKQQQITQVWSTTGLYEYLPGEKSVIVSGENKTYLADKLVSAKAQKLKIRFVLQNGELLPIDISEVKDEQIQ